MSSIVSVAGSGPFGTRSGTTAVGISRSSADSDGTTNDVEEEKGGRGLDYVHAARVPSCQTGLALGWSAESAATIPVSTVVLGQR
eukprot:936724-Pyramimonas_sp.AAC.1